MPAVGWLWPSEDDEDENANESAAHTHVVDLQLLHEKLARSLATGRESEFDQRMTLATSWQRIAIVYNNREKKNRSKILSPAHRMLLRGCLEAYK